MAKGGNAFGKGGGNGKGKGGGKDNGTSNDGPALTEYTSGGEAATSYNIEVIFEGDWTGALQQAVIDAADYLSSIILGDLPDIDGIDDLQITASLVEIDGVGGVIGQAGPEYVRLDGSWIPYEGAMDFDIADALAKVGDESWYDLVLHEMLHVLGFGTIWNVQGLTTGSISEGNLRFTGQNAIAVYQDEFAFIAANDPDSDIGVPIETGGPIGTAGGHWDEFLFTDELMTGWLDDGAYLSDMSIAALSDMGYETDFLVV